MASKNRRMFELRLGKLGLGLFISAMSLMLFGVFLLGVLVGKQLETYPDHYSLGIPDLLRERFFPGVAKTDGNVQERGEAQEAAGDEEETFDLTFYDTLVGRKGEQGRTKGTTTAPAKQERDGGPAVPVPPPASPERPTQTPAVPAAEASLAAKVPTSEAPPAAVAEKPKTVPGAPAFEVQAAAYREKVRAERLAEKMAALGFPSQVVARDLPGKGRWYRVIAGGFETREKAQGAADRLAGKIKGLKCVVRTAGKTE